MTRISAATTTSHLHELTARPICGVCRRAVEKMTEEEDTYREVVIFTARCHGESERIVIPMGDHRLKGISFGRRTVMSSSWLATRGLSVGQLAQLASEVVDLRVR